jgi:hypothetical protein
MATTTTKPTKSKKVVEEPECCGVCMENYTPIIRKKCVCKYCKADTCSKCIERYLLDRHEDAHCLHCRVNYNDNTLGEICTKTYLQHVYFKHRQEVLINRERANLPGLQDAAIVEKRRRDNEEKWRAMNVEISKLLAARDEIMAGYNKLYIVYAGQIITNPPESKKTRVKLDEILAKSEALRVKIADMRDAALRTRWAGTGIDTDDIVAVQAAAQKKEEEKKKFIRRCTRDGCQGFLSTAWKCGICEYYSCSKCFKTKTKERDDPHECTKEDLETAKLILEDCKPCPNCGEFIMKSSGCFAKDTPILLWNGASKMSQDICVGDELVGNDGLKRIVLDTTTGVDTLYEVKQNNGETYVVNSKHTLVLRNNNISEEVHILVDEYVKLDASVKNELFGLKKITDKEYAEMPISVSELGLGEYFGWKVDSNSKFLLNDGTLVKNCSQMWCISCQTPWDWNTGKVVTAGAIHNPHYYEWMRRNGQAMDRNPLDVPCGGYPNAWELRRMPHGITVAATNNFFEFHRICQELQDISGRTYRSHIDQTTTTAINTKFLLGDFDEKHWGQMLGKNERKRKRDREVQEVLAAFRMVAVELINRVQNYVSADGKIRRFTDLPVKEAEKFLEGLYKEIDELVVMINDGLRGISIGFNYSVPYIAKEGVYYSIKTKNFSGEVKKRRPKKEVEEGGADDDTASTVSEEGGAAAGGGGAIVEEPKNEVAVVVGKSKGKPKVAPAPAPATTDTVAATAVEAEPAKITIRRKKPQVAATAEPEPSLAEEFGEDAELQAAIVASLTK